ncbi:unnamed protein product [Orchesella dallaii]|uniref:Uncharacterized protein n=1 Tax=Orchesella dallaii TaxID=48710 RepID=A0ABP1PR43_9HEXA
MDKDSQNIQSSNSSRSIRLTAGRQLLIQEFKRQWDTGKDAWIAELHRFLQQQDQAITLEGTRRWVQTHGWITKPLEELSKNEGKASGSSSKLNETKNEPLAKAKMPSSSSNPKLGRATGISKKSQIAPTAAPAATTSSVGVKPRSRMSLPSAKKTPALTFSSLKRISTAMVESSKSHKIVADSLTSPPQLVYEPGGSSSSEEKKEGKRSDDPEKKDDNKIVQGSKGNNGGKFAEDSEKNNENKDPEDSENSINSESEEESNAKPQPEPDKPEKDVSGNAQREIKFDNSMIEVRRWVLTGISPCSD